MPTTPDVPPAALTEGEREALDQSLADSGCHGWFGDHPALYAAAERILSARLAARDAEWAERVAAAERERDEWKDVSVGPAYAALLTEQLRAAEERLRAVAALADEWERQGGQTLLADLALDFTADLRAVLGQTTAGEGE